MPRKSPPWLLNQKGECTIVDTKLQHKQNPTLAFIPRRVLLKISGESLCGKQPSGLDPAQMQKLVQAIKAVQAKGYEVVLVVGAGNFFRGAQGAALGIRRAVADHMGMMATVMNGLALQELLEAADVPVELFSALPSPHIVEEYHRGKAMKVLKEGKVIILAGGSGNPYFTTDTAAVLYSLELECGLFLKATQVDGVYTSDPCKDKDARKIEHLTYAYALEKGIGVMDKTALTLAHENNLPALVFSIHTPQNLVDLVEGRGSFSIINNEGPNGI